MALLLTFALMAIHVPQDPLVLTKQHAQPAIGELAQLRHALFKQESPHFSTMEKPKFAQLVCIVLQKQLQPLPFHCSILALLVLT